MTSNEPSLSRRNFLSLAWKLILGLSGLLGLGALIQYLGYQSEPASPTQFKLGDADNFPPGSRIIVPDAQAIIQNGAQGLQALSLVCPHLGCLVQPDKEGFTCPCHGSKYSLNGEYRSGPANQSLAELRLEETADGKLILHTD
jgi:cytochrome b6-f complex iron-sulfur subunit